MLSLRLTKAAVRDIGELQQFGLSEFGATATVDYLGGLHQAFAGLRDFPGMGIGRDDLRPGTRSLRYRSHRIYYRPTIDGIVIQRVLHYARIVRRDMIA